MPLWTIFHPTNTFTDTATKQALAQSITNNYTSQGLPAFYVSINFIAVQPGSQFVGAQPRQKTNPEKPFIRIAIDHIAIRLPNNNAAYEASTDRIDRALKPHIADKGYDWEYHVTETERRLWKVNGIAPPAWKSPEEKVWRDENSPVVLEGMSRPWLGHPDGERKIVASNGKRGSIVLSNELVFSQREIEAGA